VILGDALFEPFLKFTQQIPSSISIQESSHPVDVAHTLSVIGQEQIQKETIPPSRDCVRILDHVTLITGLPRGSEAVQNLHHTLSQFQPKNLTVSLPT
jgi:hypothetical protein